MSRSWIAFFSPIVLLSVTLGATRPEGDLRAVREDSRFEAAVVLATEGDFEEAETGFRAMLEDRPDHPLLLYMVGMCEFFQGKMSGATTFLTKAVEKGAPFPESYYWATRALLETGKPDLARGTLQDGLERFPGNKLLSELSRQLQAD
jgi:TolA-binding protein